MKVGKGEEGENKREAGESRNTATLDDYSTVSILNKVFYLRSETLDLVIFLRSETLAANLLRFC